MLSSGAESKVTEIWRRGALSARDATPTSTANIIHLTYLSGFFYVVTTSPKSDQKARFRTRMESDGQTVKSDRESLKRSSALSFPSPTQMERGILQGVQVILTIL
jgi:hypothetical protein